MSWLDNLRGKKRRSDVPASEGETPNGGRTVVRAGEKPAATIVKAATRFKLGDEVAGNLQIKKLLGRGGMGEVYLARQTQWDADVALKVPTDQILADPVNRHRIAREAEAWADLGLHPHIAYCYYAQLVDELLLLVIEYVDGGNLRDWIAEGRCADLKTGLNLAIQFCHGLEHAHSRGFVHRDIKPENILLTKEGLLKITDFGIVRKALAGIDSAESDSAVPKAAAAGMTTVAIGTDDYMAPEQWGPQHTIDLRADIFAFGVCLYEMLCGRRPYLRKTVGPRQEAPEPRTLRGDYRLPPRLCSLMQLCVDWDRENRPTGANQILEELCAVYEEAFGEASLNAALPEISALADGWNNRALSYMALGRTEDSEKAWQAALKADALHAESIYNYGLHRWRNAKTTDEELVRTLRGVIESDPQSWLPRYLLAQVHLERGDSEGSKEELAKIANDEAARAEVIAVRRAADSLTKPSGLVRAFEGDPEFVDSACITADGQYAVSGHWDKLKLWDVASGRCLRRFEGHKNSMRSFCISADGRYALSGGLDKTLKLMDVGSGLCLRSFEGHARSIESVSLSASGQCALSGSSDNTLRLWDVASGRCMRIFEGLYGVAYSVCLSVDGRYGLSGYMAGQNTLKLWDLASGLCLRTFEGHTGGVTSVCMSADGQYALSGSADSTLKLWDVGSGGCLRTFEGHTDWVTSVCMRGDGCVALSGSRDKTLKLWNVASGRCVRTFEGHTEWVASVSLSADGRNALSNGGKMLRLWNVGAFGFAAKHRLGAGLSSADAMMVASRYQTAVSDAHQALLAGNGLGAWTSLRRAREQAGYRRATPGIREWVKLYKRLRKRTLADCWQLWTFEASILSVCQSPNGQYALSGYGDNCPRRKGPATMKLWDVISGRCLRTFDGHPYRVSSLCMSADGQTALSGGWDQPVKLWDVAGGFCLRTFEGATRPTKSVCLSRDGRYALSGEENTLILWEVTNGRCLRTFEGHAWYVEAVCLSSNGQYALSGSADKTLKLWDVPSGRCLRTFEGHTEWVKSVCLSADELYALSGGNDHSVRLWEVASGRCLRTFEGHTDFVESVCMSTDGQHALSGGADNTLRLWDVASGRCVRVIEGHTERVRSVCLSVDGQHIVSGGDVNITAWFLDWELEENELADWDERARPYLKVFLGAHRAYTETLPYDRQPTEEELTRALTRRGRPVWSETEFQGFLHTLGCAGFGWLRPEGVRSELERMTANLSFV